MGRTLPLTHRPGGIRYRAFAPGLDLPCWFEDDLKRIDNKLYLVYHPYDFIWDVIINNHTGSLADPRFNIHLEDGEECWGWVLRNPDGSPKLDQSWHIWRLCLDYGWAHVVKIESKEPEYLNLLTNRLFLQATLQDQYGDKAYSRKLDEDQDNERLKAQKNKEELFGSVQEENSWLMKRAMENLSSGIINPTNPTHESVISYPGQKNRSRIIRPLEDREGGLILPD